MLFPFGFDGQIRQHESLARHSSFKIGGETLYFAEPLTQEDLVSHLEFVDREDMPCLLIGNASNILFADEDFEGLVIALNKFELNRLHLEDQYVTVSAGMGLIWLAHILADHSLGGMEFMSTIPGTVGGALVMNAGVSPYAGKLHQMADWVVEIKTLGRDGFVKTLKREDIAFQYRSSNLEGQVILEATFKLEFCPCEDTKRELRANLQYRESVQELRYPSAGSIFKNPKGVEMTAGKLIDLVGLRGLRIGGAQISEKHGNFIVNLGNAKAGEVLELIAVAKEKVKEKFGVDLELEVKYISGEMMPLSI